LAAFKSGGLPAAERTALVSVLMTARSAVKSAKAGGDEIAEAAAHHAVNVVKRKLGERSRVVDRRVTRFEQA